MCPGQGRTVPERKAESSGAVRHRAPWLWPVADDDDSSISPSGADKGMDCFGKTDEVVECRGREG